MSLLTRRDFLQNGSAGLLCAAGLLRSTPLWAQALGLPIGLQLYSVREMLPGDFAGTLKRIGALGYREVEAAGFLHHTAAEVKAAMSTADLRCVSAHYPYDELHSRFDEIVAFHKELGATYIICSSPGYKTPPAAGARPGHTLEDWRWNAAEFNKFGERAKAAGLQFGYHNHTPEFAKEGGVTPYDELLRLTEPALVTFEMDCGWVTVGGGDPIEYLRRHGDRISMLHVKDFKPAAAGASPGKAPEPTELGRGTTNFKALFAAADNGHIKHYFVEQEGFDMPPFESLKVDADFMRNLKVS